MKNFRLESEKGFDGTIEAIRRASAMIVKNGSWALGEMSFHYLDKFTEEQKLQLLLINKETRSSFGKTICINKRLLNGDLRSFELEIYFKTYDKEFYEKYRLIIE